MPLYPGASQGCDECRRRHKKCDLTEPECHRCCKASIKCSGPKDPRTFIHRNAANLSQQTHRKALAYALQNRRQLESTATDSEISSTRDDFLPQRTTLSATEPSPPSDLISTDLPGHLIFLALIKDFTPVAQGGIFSGDRISRDNPIYSSVGLCIRALLPLTSLRIELLDLPIFSLLTTYMGNLRSDRKLAQLAQLSYTSALQKSRPHIQKVIASCNPGAQPKANLELILLLAIAFQAFEVRVRIICGKKKFFAPFADRVKFVSGNESSEAALLAHIGGVLSVLELSGPQHYSSPQIRQAFSGFRGILLSVALHKHLPTFLAEPDWIRLPFRNFRKTRIELLHDIALQIPGLFYRTDRLIYEPVNPACNDLDCLEFSKIKNQDLDTALSLLNEYWAVFHKMEEWLNNWKVSEQGPLYWHSAIPMPSMVMEVDPNCIPSFADEKYQVRFQSGQKAGLAVTFWSFRLELLMGMIKLQRSMLGNQDDALEGNLAMAEESACLILQTLPYLSCCFEGILASKAPLQTIASYFEFRNIGARLRD